MQNGKNEAKYNGWSNYETWTVSLWLDNEEPSYRFWRNETARQRRAAEECDRTHEGRLAGAEAARWSLAEQLKRAITDAAPLREPTLYSDLLSAALAEVNWLEIADHWMSD